MIEVHTTTGLRLLRALAERGEAVPSYLEPAEALPPLRQVARKDRSTLDRSALEAAATSATGHTPR